MSIWLLDSLGPSTSKAPTLARSGLIEAGAGSTVQFAPNAIDDSVIWAPEVIRHGENGFLHAPDDVDGMVESIRGALRDPAGLAKLEKEARRTAVEEFGVENAVQKYLRIYEQALSS